MIIFERFLFTCCRCKCWVGRPRWLEEIRTRPRCALQLLTLAIRCCRPHPWSTNPRVWSSKRVGRQLLALQAHATSQGYKILYYSLYMLLLGQLINPPCTIHSFTRKLIPNFYDLLDHHQGPSTRPRQSKYHGFINLAKSICVSGHRQRENL